MAACGFVPSAGTGARGQTPGDPQCRALAIRPVVWDRKRAEQLFDFSYRLERYTPAQKRQYGYFVLPLLHKGQLVGRMDAKMHRKTGMLEVIALWLEEGIKVTAGLEKGLTSALSEFARWQGAHEIVLGRVPAGLFTTCRGGWETGTP